MLLKEQPLPCLQLRVSYAAAQAFMSQARLNHHHVVSCWRGHGAKGLPDLAVVILCWKCRRAKWKWTSCSYTTGHPSFQGSTGMKRTRNSFYKCTYLTMKMWRAKQCSQELEQHASCLSCQVKPLDSLVDPRCLHLRVKLCKAAAAAAYTGYLRHVTAGAAACHMHLYRIERSDVRLGVPCCRPAGLMLRGACDRLCRRKPIKRWRETSMFKKAPQI